MTLPELYREGLTQRALRGPEQLNGYKVGLVEAILKEAERQGQADDVMALRSAIETALEVVRWEMPRSRPGT